MLSLPKSHSHHRTRSQGTICDRTSSPARRCRWKRRYADSSAWLPPHCVDADRQQQVQTRSSWTLQSAGSCSDDPAGIFQGATAFQQSLSGHAHAMNAARWPVCVHKDYKGPCRLKHPTSSAGQLACLKSVHLRPAGSCFRKASAIILHWTGESPSFLRQVEPKGDLVLVEVAEAEAKTTGGVLLPTAAQKKPTSGANSSATHGCTAACMSNRAESLVHTRVHGRRGGSNQKPAGSRIGTSPHEEMRLTTWLRPAGDIAALGDGRQGTQTRGFTTKPGDTVLYSKFGIGCTDVSVQVGGQCTPAAPHRLNHSPAVFGG